MKFTGLTDRCALLKIPLICVDPQFQILSKFSEYLKVTPLDGLTNVILILCVHFFKIMF